MCIRDRSLDAGLKDPIRPDRSRLTSSGVMTRQTADNGSERLHAVRSMRSAEGLFVADGDQRIVHWSASAEQLLGHRAEDVVGLSLIHI